MFGPVVKHTFHAAKDSTAEAVHEQAPCSPAWSMPCKRALPLTSRKYWLNLKTGKASALTFAGIHDSNDRLITPSA